MFKNKLIPVGVFLVSALSYASAKDDIAFINDLYKQERYEMAVSESDKFIANYPDSKYNKNLCERMAKVYFIQKNYKEAEVYFNKLLNEYKIKKAEREEVYSYLYKINRARKNDSQAFSYIEGFIKNTKLYEKTLYDTGCILLDMREYNRAIEDFTKVANIKGDFYEISVLYIAMALYNDGSYKDSLKYLDYYNNIPTENKDKATLNYLYGSCYYKMLDTEKAISYFEENINKYPNDNYTTKGRLTLIEIFLNKGNKEKALMIYSEINKNSDKKLGAKIIGDYFLAQGEYKRAINFYEIIGENKDDSTRYSYAYSFYKVNNYKKSALEFSKIKDDKYLLDARYYTILSYYNMKDYNKTLSFQKYLPTYETDVKKYSDLSIIFGESYYEIKDFDKAHIYYKNIYKDYPTEENLYRLIVLETKLDDEKSINENMAIYRKGYSGKKADYKRDLYLALGDYYYKKDKVQEAQDIYKEYMQNDSDAEIGKDLVNMLINEKKYTEVIDYLGKMEQNDDTLYLRAIANMGIGEYASADKILNILKNKESTSSELREKISYNLIKNNFLWEKYENVIKEGEEYLAGSYVYKLDDIVDRIGLSYYRIGNYDKARSYFDKLSEVPEYAPYARFQIADSYFTEKDYKLARDNYKKVKGKDYEEDARYWEIQCILNLGLKEEYLSTTKSFIHDYPNSLYAGNLMSVRGNILSEMGKNAEAVKEYETIYENSKQDIDKDTSIEKIVEIYDKMDNNEQKNIWIEKFSDKYKKSYYKSISLREKNMLIEAREEEKILLESPRYKDYALVNMANDSYNDSKYDEAEKYYKEIKEMERSEFKDLAVFQLGNIYFVKSDFDKAIIELSKVFVLYPESKYVIPSKLKLAESYENKNDIKKAKDIYKELYKNINASDYKEYVIEKLLFINLKEENMLEAENFYKELESLNKEVADKYKEFFIPPSEEGVLEIQEVE